MVSAMNLKVSYYPSDDILLLENGGQWKDGGNVVENVVAYADAENRPAAIEISGARKLLCQALYAEKENAAPQNFATPATGERPDESEIDRVCWPLTVNYDRKADTLTLESGLPTTYGIVIADGLTAFYDGEDEYGKFINAVRLENAANLAKQYLPSNPPPASATRPPWHTTRRCGTAPRRC